MKISGHLKDCAIYAVITVAFFLILEIGSRVAYSLYTHSTSYLTYGFSSIFKGKAAPEGVDDGRPVFRIVCCGGSTTTGWPPQTRQNDPYPYYLERYLKERFPGRRIIVENLGIPAATTVEAAYMARAAMDMDINPSVHGGLDKDKIERLCGPERQKKIPDLVVLYSHVTATFVENMRLKNILSEKEYNEIRRITPEITLRGRPLISRAIFNIDHFLKTRSFLYYSLDRITFWLQHDRYIVPKKEIKGKGAFLAMMKLQNKISHLQKYVKTSNLRDTMEMAVYTAKRLKIPIIIGTEPIAAGRYTDDMNEEFVIIHQINADVIRKIGYDNNVPVFDAFKLFNETPGSSAFFDTSLMHLNRDGDKFLGEKLGEFIAQQGYIK